MDNSLTGRGQTDCSLMNSLAETGLTGQIWGVFTVSKFKTNSSGLDSLTETGKTDSSKSDTMAVSERGESSEIAFSAGSERDKCSKVASVAVT